MKILLLLILFSLFLGCTYNDHIDTSKPCIVTKKTITKDKTWYEIEFIATNGFMGGTPYPRNYDFIADKDAYQIGDTIFMIKK